MPKPTNPLLPANDMDDSVPKSPNFSYLAAHHNYLVHYAARAERYLFEDPSTALIKLRQFAELLAQQACAYVGVVTTPEDDMVTVLNLLREHRIATKEILELFHGIRKTGNAAAHEGKGTCSDALHYLRMARQLAIWFHRSFGSEPSFTPGPFLPPPDPAQSSLQLQQELEQLRTQVVEQQRHAEQAKENAHQAQMIATHEAELRRRAELQAQTAYADLHAALSLADETEALLAQKRAQFEQQLVALQASVAARPPNVVQAVIKQAQHAATLLELDEAATRRIIDQQLRDAGWEADSDEITFTKGIRPQKGKNLAIGEWPTVSGPADYVLFAGLTPIATVEAKKALKDVPSAVEQAKRYSRTFLAQGGEESAGGPWGDYKVPFCFATNGRPFLRQIQTKSGIWFLDARLATNHPRPLEGWYSPAGLSGLFQVDVPAADQKLRDESPEFLPLRDYQFAAIRAVEQALSAGQREMLLAMATGTGKTRTCIGLVYRLLKAKRFRRILFLVDRTALGEQATDAFKDVKLENFQPLAEIYDVKEMGDVVPDPDTRLHVATVQGMVKRHLFPDEGTPALPVDTYDCIVVDECHRGYALDKELSEAEFAFRDEADYISKYRRVLDHFDAVKVGLTATPAIHTTEIFGPPVFAYSYRQAVIDGWLVDHEPPIRIVTRLAEDGITWKKGEVIQTLLPFTGEIDPVTAPDEVQVEIEDFNRKVVTENFNKVVCAELVRHIDPGLPGKTIVFCATDNHADLVVYLLKKAFEAQYGAVEDNAVMKITAAADRPLQLIRRFKNERLPSVAVTVDLLSTGIDVEEVTNIVFLRRVRSRILYEQMLGRATRLCPDLYGPKEDKECFRVFDAVDLYVALLPYTSMKPVVVDPNLTFAKLVEQLGSATTDDAHSQLHDELVAKLQRARRLTAGKNREKFEGLAGMSFQAFMSQVRAWSPQQAQEWIAQRPQLVRFLDRARNLDHRVLLSEHEDELRRLERGYGTSRKPEDYIESFRLFVTENAEKIPALLVVAQRPRDLTRQQLRELKLALDAAGFTEAGLQTAWREVKNQDIAATIIGYIRHVANGQPLLPYKERVQKAMQQILASRPWTQPQRRWLERIGKQVEMETIVDREALDHGQFRAEGGFNRLNKVFDGNLEDILRDLTDAVWQTAA